MGKARKVSVYSSKHRHIPMTKTDYVRQGGRWVPVHEEREMVSREQAGWILGSTGLPFERSHRREKKDRYGHEQPFDTFSSVSPDGRRRTKWYVDFAQGDRNLSKLLRKSFNDRMRYKARKAKKAGQGK